MHTHTPLQLKTSTPVWDTNKGLFAEIKAVGFVSLTFKTTFYPVSAILEYTQSGTGGQTLQINGVNVAVNPVANSETVIALYWQSWGGENLKILGGDLTPQPGLEVDKIPLDVPYALSITVPYNVLKPNFNVTGCSGPLDFTLTGTSLGASGLITFQVMNETFAVNFVNGVKEGNHTYKVGAGQEVAITYIHTSAGLKYYCANPI